MSEPLHYITVTAPDGNIAGYAWADSTEVGFVHRAVGSPRSFATGAEWRDKLYDAHRRGLSPAGVLGLFSREPGAGRVTEAPNLAALEELARTLTPADEQRLLGHLAAPDDPAWQELAEAHDALTDADREVPWGGGQRRPNGAIQVPYPVYSEPLRRVVTALWNVGAVSPDYRISSGPIPQVPPSGRMAPADAVRAATAVLAGERRCDGMIADAVKDGTFDALVAALRAWHAGVRAGRLSEVARGGMDATAVARAHRADKG
ncbi:DUF6508 domain-containing protein [Streptomyces thermoviolaceus]|uniref:DUF6508 domain-containing protein n=1 Tax=Streptomyces thermoviolaceus TaxID=1952 RepID=UPI0020415332|nr:DUF6508 domain-containing protein [Streptomyces thermoviolaceus]MCM3266498.1 DUF6508 domain-containing protein [Streptomyces thermoviolaceus]